MKKIIISLVLILIFDLVFLKGISRYMSIVDVQKGQLFLISLITFCIISFFEDKVNEFFEKISETIGLLLFWGGFIGIILILHWLGVSYMISTMGIFGSLMIYGVVKCLN